MSFIDNDIRKATVITEDRSYNWESEDGQEDASAILILAAAIAAGLVEVVEDRIIGIFKK